jgi:hypothetical protein
MRPVTLFEAFRYHGESPERTCASWSTQVPTANKLMTTLVSRIAELYDAIHLPVDRECVPAEQHCDVHGRHSRHQSR